MYKSTLIARVGPDIRPFSISGIYFQYPTRCRILKLSGRISSNSILIPFNKQTKHNFLNSWHYSNNLWQFIHITAILSQYPVIGYTVSGKKSFRPNSNTECVKFYGYWVAELRIIIAIVYYQTLLLSQTTLIFHSKWFSIILISKVRYIDG